METFGDTEQLERSVSLTSGVALIVSSIIGSGIFASPGPVLLYTNAAGYSIITWLFAGLLALTGGLCYAELGTMIPSSGGEHPYLMRAFGSLPAFLFSWTGILVSRPASIAIVSTICAQYVSRLLFNDHSSAAIKLIAVSVIVILSTINCLSTKLNNSIQNVLTVLKVTSLVSIGLLGFAALGRPGTVLTQKGLFESPTKDIGKYALAVHSALWAYEGWYQSQSVSLRSGTTSTL
jgi:amino acid transporter